MNGVHLLISPRDRITLVAGDGDYESAVTQLVVDGLPVTVLHWLRRGSGFGYRLRRLC